MIPATISARLAMRARLDDSPSSRIPVMAAPTAPMPVQTAYAVPTGSDRIAQDNNTILTIIAVTVMTLGVRRVKPWVYLRPIAHTTSSRPAMKRMIQDSSGSLT